MNRLQVNNRILILRSNPVNPDSRVEKEAITLHEAGYRVDILCWDRESNHRTRKEYLYNRIPIYRYGAKATYSEGIKNLIPYLRFQLTLFWWILKRGKEYTVIHACDFDTAWCSYLPARIRGCRFIFDIFDYICGKPRNPIQLLVKTAENLLVNQADSTIVCTEQRLKQIAGTKPKRVVVIHNTPDTNVNLSNSPTHVNKHRISIVYVGVLLQHRLLSEMISVFERRPEIDFYVGGFGLLEQQFIEASKKNPNIHFLGRLQYEQALSLESECDIMTAIYDPSLENHKYAAPNKFYEALMLGKPIIMVKGTGMSSVIEEKGIGELIDYSEDGFERGLDRLITRQKEWGRISNKMNVLYWEHYDWGRMKKRLVRMYSDLGCPTRESM